MKTRNNAIVIAIIAIITIVLTSCAEEYFNPVPVAHYDQTYKVDGIGYGVNNVGHSAVVLEIFPESIEAGVLTIPEVITVGNEHYIVKSIERLACSKIEATSVILPACMETIGTLAFSKCEYLKTVTLRGTKCPSASNSAFDSNTLKNATLIYPAGLELSYPFLGFKHKFEY